MNDEVDKVLQLAFFSGVTVHLEEVDLDAAGVSQAPSGPDWKCGSRAREVWWSPELDEYDNPVDCNGVPDWMRLLHEVAHAATAAEGQSTVGCEDYASAFELWACIQIWGLFSPQSRACISWSQQTDSPPSSSRFVWSCWKTGWLGFRGHTLAERPS